MVAGRLFFWKFSKVVMTDTTIDRKYTDLNYSDKISTYLEQVLQLEAVACKDWLTNKVDRCVGGKVAKQQTTGQMQLPLNNCGVMALDLTEKIATSGHSPFTGSCFGKIELLLLKLYQILFGLLSRCEQVHFHTGCGLVKTKERMLVCTLPYSLP
jgi:hypothetical protein